MVAAISSANVIIGAAKMWIADYGTALPTLGTDAEAALDGDVNWNFVGATQDGIEVSYEPSYTDIMVDQLRSPAKVYSETVTMNIRTNLAEASLQNLIYAWGLDLAGDAPTDGTDVADIYIENLSTRPKERSIVVVGGSPDNGTDERVYHAYRAINVDSSSHSYARGQEVIFPISLRCLPDTANSNAYGTIEDL